MVDFVGVSSCNYLPVRWGYHVQKWRVFGFKSDDCQPMFTQSEGKVDIPEE